MRAVELEHLREDPPAGILVLDLNRNFQNLEEFIASLSLLGVPFVMSGDHEAMHSCDRICSDHRQGGYALTSWLIAKGRKRILNLWPENPDRYWLKAKWSGYSAAVDAAGLERLEPLTMVERPDENLDAMLFHDEACRYAGHLAPHLLSRNVDAIMAHTDKIARLAIAACKLLGVTPNVDADIAGYDNYWEQIDRFRFWEPMPPLASVDKQNELIGREIVNLLFRRIAGEGPAEPVKVLVPPRLVIVGQPDAKQETNLLDSESEGE